MNFKTFTRIITCCLTAMLALTTAQAQNQSSPYSRFGYGLLSDNATSAQRQMGSVGYAMNSGRQINVMNPASYAAIDSLTFLLDMGLDFTYLTRTDNGGSMHDFGGGIDYLTMQFPVTKYMGVSLGLLPYTSVGYSFGNEIDNGSMSHQGSGGINQLYAGLGAKPFKNFYIGANVSYLFGNTYNDVYATTAANKALFEQVMTVRDYHLLFGVQYTIPLNLKNRITLGLTYSPQKTLLGDTYIQKYLIESTSTTPPDTVWKSPLKNRYSLPDTWGAGIAYEYDRRLFVEADLTYQNWGHAKWQQRADEVEEIDFTATQLTNRYRAALGTSFTPALRGGYLRRVTYRLGASVEREYIVVRSNHVRDYTLSCGFGLPSPAGKTVINLGFEYRHRQAHPDPLLKEEYFNVTLGINFNQLWFFQNKIR